MQSEVEAARSARRYAQHQGHDNGRDDGSGGVLDVSRSDRQSNNTPHSGSSAAVIALENEISQMEAHVSAQRMSKMQQYAANKKIKMLKAKLIRQKRADAKARK